MAQQQTSEDDQIMVIDEERTPSNNLEADINEEDEQEENDDIIQEFPSTASEQQQQHRTTYSTTPPNSSIHSGLNGGESSMSPIDTPTRPKYSAKLRTASRAIGLFRRAAGTLSRSLTIGQMNKSTSNTSNLTDIGLAEQQQQDRRASSTKRRRSSTFRRFMMRHQSTGNSSQYSLNSASPNMQATSSANGSGGGGSNILSMSDSSQQQQIAAFIVPRMNALKLPLKCLIRSLEGELMREVFVHRYELGQFLIENLKVSLGMNDCKYFGLRLAMSCDDQEDVKNIWLDLNESVCKQIKNKACVALLASSTTTSSANKIPANGNSSSADASSKTTATTSNGLVGAANNSSRTIEFYLRIKFYPPNLARINDSFLRNYLWLQLRRDLRLGKLTSSMNNLAQLMACILQYEFGDFKQEHLERLPEMNIMPNQDLVEDTAIDLWRTKLVNFKRHQAQMQFLRAAIILETYGFDYYPVRDHQRQRAYLLGFNYAGVKTIRNGRIVHHFRWHSISKISYERRMIIFHIYPTENSKRKQILGFKCMSNDYCQNLYMRLLEQKYFFTVDLTYFDKSIRRPSCLYSSPDGGGGGSSLAANQSGADWTTNNSSFDDQLQQHSQFQRQQTFGNRPSMVRASGSLEDPPTASVSSTPDCGAGGGGIDCTDCYQQQQYHPREPVELVRSATTPADSSFENETMISEQHESSQQQQQQTTWQRRAALVRLHRQQTTAVSFNDTTVTNNQEETSGLLPVQSAPGDQKWTKFQDAIRQIIPVATAGRHQADGNYLMPILKLLLMILVTNLALRLTDSLSCALITLLTFSSSGASASASSSGGGQVEGEFQAPI